MERRTVMVTGLRTGSVVSIAIDDNGPGMPEKARENLFAAFRGSVRSGGTGLGLAIARELVLAHGGTIALVEKATPGTLFRIELPEVDLTAAAQPGTSPAKVEDVNEALKDVVDPELGINVVDLGLIYGITVDDSSTAIIDMTLTSAACPLTDVIEDQTRQALTTGPGGGLVQDFRINWVWLPPWGPDKITDDGREQLRALGFNV